MYLLCLFVLVLSSTARSDEDCSSSKQKIPAIKLRKQLLCDYDKNVRPVLNHKKAVTVDMRILLKYYHYDIHENSFTIDGWMTMYWFDEHLQWKPSDYDSISQIQLSDSDIWMPDVSVYNRRSQGGDQSLIETATCLVENNGLITCVPSTRHSTICTSDLSKYPFDTHNCTVSYGSWVHNGEELNIEAPPDAIITSDLIPNSEWSLVATDVLKHIGEYDCCPNNTYPSINFSFKIKRKSGAHAASVILPAVAVMVITFAALLMSPDNRDRLHLCYVNLLAAFMHLEYISWMVPLNGDRVPLILLFARDSLILTTFSIVITLLLKGMMELERPAPEWISKILSLLTAFKPGQIIVPNNVAFKGLNEQSEEDSIALANNEEKGSQKADWAVFAKILDRLCAAIYFIVYVIMLAAFSP